MMWVAITLTEVSEQTNVYSNKENTSNTIPNMFELVQFDLISMHFCWIELGSHLTPELRE